MKPLFKALVAVTVLGAGSAMAASSVTTSLSVSANIAKSCAISADTDLAFGAYDPTAGGDDTASGTVTFKCTKNTGWTMKFDFGVNGTATQRKMVSDVTATEKLDYQIFLTDGSTPAGDGVTGTAATGTGAGLNAASSTYTYFGAITAGQDVEAANYSDTVTLTIEY